MPGKLPVNKGTDMYAIMKAGVRKVEVGQLVTVSRLRRAKPWEFWLLLW